MALIILSNVNLKNVLYSKRDLEALLFLKKERKKKKAFSCVIKNFVTNFMTLIPNPSIAKLSCPWNLPILNLNITLSIITIVQAFPPTLCDLTIHCVEEKCTNFFLLVYLQNHDHKYIYPNESRRIIMSATKPLCIWSSMGGTIYSYNGNKLHWFLS